MKKKWVLRRVREESRLDIADTKFVSSDADKEEGNELSSCPSHSVTPCNGTIRNKID